MNLILNKDLTVNKSYHINKINAYINYGSISAYIGDIPDSFFPNKIKKAIEEFRESILPENILDTIYEYLSDEDSQILTPLLLEGASYKFYDETYSL